MQTRVALVTGGIGGLGVAICRHLARSGHRVVAADLGTNRDRVDAFLAAVADTDGAIGFEAVDVADPEACTALAARIDASHGGVSVLVNAAGITRDTTLRKMSLAQWDDVLRVNLDGAFHMTRAVVDGMAARGFGRIVNVSSVNGQTGQFGQANYSAAKAGLHGFTMALAREVASKGVTVNSVSPGYCETALVMAVPETVRERIVAGIPVGRLGRPDEIARVVDFLCSPESAYITGANIPVNGGYYMSF